MRTDELDYRLPEELIAVRPARPRDSARLLVLRRDRPGAYEHRVVRDLPELLASGDRLVVNNSRVLPARLVGHNIDTGGRIEGLFLEERPGPQTPGAPGAPGTPEHTRPRWSVMIKARRHRTGARLALHDHDGAPCGVTLELLGRDDEAEGAWLVDVDPGERTTGAARSTIGVLNRVGRTPIPPYIRQARKAGGVDVPDAEDQDEYQTVYARDASDPGADPSDARAGSDPAAGSVAAPTAGLHFTDELLGRLASMGVRRGTVELHVGAGTFRPIETDTLGAHHMHAEWCALGDSAGWLGDRLDAGPAAPASGAGRVVAVGTTTARTLESFAALPRPWPAWTSTELFIAPGHRWLGLDAMLTNFHLPRSSLLAMVGAFLPGGVPELLDAYRAAIAERYRFYSYGDAMLIL